MSLFIYESIIFLSLLVKDLAFSVTGESSGLTLKWASRLKIAIKAAQG